MFGSFRRSRLLPLLAAATVSLGACSDADSPLAPADEAPSAEVALATSQRIAFLSSRVTPVSIYKMDPTGGSVARVSKLPDGVYEPAWSYDNKRIAVNRARTEDGITHSDVWIMNADGSNGHWARGTMSPWTLLNPSWAPDGSHLLVSMYLYTQYYLGKLDLASGDITLLHPVGGGVPGFRAAYDKAGKRIVYVGPNANTIEQVDAAGNGHKVLYQTAQSVDRPQYSPDGGRIAFQKGPLEGNLDILVKTLSTGTVKQITSSSSFDGAPTWSPDGTRIAFVSTRSGQAQIWTVAAAGGPATRITHTSASETSPAWTH